MPFFGFSSSNRPIRFSMLAQIPSSGQGDPASRHLMRSLSSSMRFSTLAVCSDSSSRNTSGAAMRSISEKS